MVTTVGRWLCVIVLLVYTVQGSFGATCLQCLYMEAGNEDIQNELDTFPNQTRDCRVKADQTDAVECAEGMVCAAVYMEAVISTPDVEGVEMKYWSRYCVDDVTGGNLAEMTRCHDLDDYKKKMKLGKDLNSVLREFDGIATNVTGSVCLCDPNAVGDNCNNKKTSEMKEEAARSTTGMTCIFDCTPELPTDLYQSCKRCDVLFFCKEGEKTNMACRGNKIWRDDIKKCRLNSNTCTPKN